MSEPTKPIILSDDDYWSDLKMLKALVETINASLRDGDIYRFLRHSDQATEEFERVSYLAECAEQLAQRVDRQLYARLEG